MVQAKNKAYSRRSFLALTGDFTFYGFGLSFASIVTILPAFVSKLSGSNLLIGLITTISVLGFNGPQILVTNYIEKQKTRKGFIMLYTLGERIPWLLLAALTVLLPSSNSSLLLVSFFLTYAVVNVSAGITAPAWFDLVAKVVPEGRRGWYFGLSNFLATILGVAGGAAAGFLIDSLGFPLGYAACFAAAFALMMVSYASLWAVDEPESSASGSEQNLMQYLRSLPDVLRADNLFSKYLMATLVAGVTTMGSAFLTAHALRTTGAGGEALGLYTAVYFASQVLSNIVWAYLGDTKGHVFVITVGGMLGALASIMAILSTDYLGFGIAFALTGAYMSNFTVSWWSAIMDFATEERRPTYLALAGVLRSLPASLAPLAGGMIADAFGNVWVFGIATVAYLISTLMMFSLMLSMRKPAPTVRGEEGQVPMAGVPEVARP